MSGFRKFKVAFKHKAFLFNVFDVVPFGSAVYYALQRHVTRTIPRNLVPTAEVGETQIGQFNKLRQYVNITPETQFVEFGAGWDLYSNLIYYCLGVDRQMVMDLTRWAKAETINAVVDYLQKDPPAGAIRLPRHHVAEQTLEHDLRAHYGIDYRAPYDATKMDLPDASIDVIKTTSVFEHIPLGVIPGILKECRRVLKPTGYMNHCIDYSDHYSHADAEITPFNYLRFDAKEWATYNPGIHYQNRLRTKAYQAMFTDAGFRVVDLEEWLGITEELQSVSVDKGFKNLSYDELLTLGSKFTLAPAQAA